MFVSFINNSVDATTYLWDFGDSIYSTNPHPVHPYTSEGEYIVILIAYNECGSDTSVQTIQIGPFFTGVLDNNKFKVDIYPNPNSGIFDIRISSKETGEINITVENLNGQIVHTEKITKISDIIIKKIDLSNLCVGTYNVKIKTKSRLINKKIIVK